MTKINKLGKSTFVIAILSFILVAVLAFGGTYAYFSATSNTATGKVNLGHLRITENSAKFDSETLTTGATIVVPNQTILDATPGTEGADLTAGATSGKMTVEVDSNINYFIRAKITYEVEIVNTVTEIVTPDDPETDEDETVTNTLNCAAGECNCTDKALKRVLIITPGVEAETDGEVTTAGWIAGLNAAKTKELNDAATQAATQAGTEVEYTYVQDMDMDGVQGTGWYYYNTVCTPKAAAVAGATKNTQTHEFAITARVNPQVGQVESEHFMDAVITISVVFEVVQADYIISDAAANTSTRYTADVLQKAWAKADAAYDPSIEVDLGPIVEP